MVVEDNSARFLHRLDRHVKVGRNGFGPLRTTGSGADCPQTNGVPSSPAMPVRFVLTQRHPFHCGIRWVWCVASMGLYCQPKSIQKPRPRTGDTQGLPRRMEVQDSRETGLLV